MSEGRKKKAATPGPTLRVVEPRCEWVGGRVVPPFFITDRPEPYRPVMAVWMELPSGVIVGQELATPEEGEGVVARALQAALERPLVGLPRRPDGLRVKDDATAIEVRGVVGESIGLSVAPTPEIDAFFEEMASEMPRLGEEASYLQGGRIPATAVEALFRAGETLYRLAPWRRATNGEVLRVDIPALEVSGACICIIGSLGESLGALVFPSFAGYLKFMSAARRDRGGKRPDPGTGWLAICFERGAYLTQTQRREVVMRGWRVADANAYPVVTRHERDGASRPLVERDVKIATACATTLASFLGRHLDVLQTTDVKPQSESYFDEDMVEVRLTVPYDAYDQFDPVPPRARATAKPGRNDPCYCGSGRKYKNCHFLLPEE